MAVLVECPRCKRRSNSTKEECPCGFKLAKFSGKTYWIEFYVEGRRKRERIGPNKDLAETVLRKRLVERAEGRLLDKKKDDRTTLAQLAGWYLKLPEVKAKKSHERDERSVKKLKDFFASKLVKEVTPSLIEAYRQHSLTQLNYKKQTNKPATVNREISCLKTIFSKALKNGMIERNPVSAIRQLKEDNERNRVLSLEEWKQYSGGRSKSETGAGGKL